MCVRTEIRAYLRDEAIRNKILKHEHWNYPKEHTYQYLSSNGLESILWGEVFWAQTPQEREFPHEFESKKIFEIRLLEIYVTGVTLTPSPVKCSKVAVGGREPCISERAKRVSGLL